MAVICPYCEKDITLGKTICSGGKLFHKSCWKTWKAQGFVKTPGKNGAGPTKGLL